MSTRQIALAGTLLAIVFLAHAAGRFTQVGGAQFAPSIGIYVLMALLLAPQLGWGALAGIGLATGILTMLATSSPFPAANIVAHGLAFLLAAALTKSLGRGSQEMPPTSMVGIITATLLLSWFLFATVSWLGLVGSGHPLTQRSFESFGVGFGSGLVGFWAFTFVTVAIPTYIISLILTPLLYRSVRPALVRQGMIPAGAGSGGERSVR